MKSQKFLAVACVSSLLGSSVQAAAPTSITEAVEMVRADSVLLSGWVSNEFKRAIPFNSTAGNVVPTQFKLFGIGFGISAVVSATKMDNDALHNLGTSLLDTREIDTFERFPFPMILAHAKIGLPFGLDAGIRLGGIPEQESDEGDTHVEVKNKVVGLDLRKKVIEEGITRPFGLTVGLNYTHSSGEISATTPYTPNIGDVTFSADTKGTMVSEWETDSVGIQAILNKKILFINPYLGASVNKNFGDVETTITNTGTATYVPAPATQTFSSVGSAKESVDGTDLRALFGMEFSILPFLKLGLHGEYANQNKLAGSLGLRFQFR
jgi:hypothetical protein